MAKELGVTMGETTPDGAITLTRTPCIGMSDQAPAALVNDVVVTHLTPDRGRQLVRDLRRHLDPQQLVTMVGDGNNAHPLVRSMVRNNIRQRGPVHFADFEPGSALRTALAREPREVLAEIKASRLRGRGGAGFPTGMKWELARNAAGPRRYVICNADEGEPGTFKDRVLLTECPDLMFEGMTIAGYAVGSDTGIVYLRGEYRYLLKFLESVLEERRRAGLAGPGHPGQARFQLRHPHPAGRGRLRLRRGDRADQLVRRTARRPQEPPAVPAAEGLPGARPSSTTSRPSAAPRASCWRGPPGSRRWDPRRTTGTKVLSISGDCRKPGVYEVPFGITARRAAGDGRGGQSRGDADRRAVPPDDRAGALRRPICYDDLATGGAIMIFNRARNQLEIAEHYLDFFIEESCGYCTPCRVGLVAAEEHRAQGGHRRGRAGRPGGDARAVEVHRSDQPLRPGPDRAQPGARRPGELHRRLRQGWWQSGNRDCCRRST